MPTHDTGLLSVVILLATAVLVVALFKRLRLSPILGYLVAGTLIGEYGFAFLNSHDVATLAHYGVVFLLFAIGLELTIERLLAMRWYVFGLGTLQFILTSAIFGYLLTYLGVNTAGSIVIGGALALSSTAMVIRVMQERNLASLQVGRVSLATLLLQDFAVVPLLVLVPLLAGKQLAFDMELSTALITALGRATIAMTIIFIVGRLLLRPLFDLIAATKSEELFMATNLLLVLGMAWITDEMELSLALGAFVAGLLVAETQYQHRVEDNIRPFKDLLMGLFFMSVGMSINVQFIIDNLAFVFALTGALIILKAGIVTGVCRAFRLNWNTSIHAGFLLAQGSEFAFVVATLAMQPAIGVITAEQATLLMIVITLSMALTPFMTEVGRFIATKVERAEGQYEESGELFSDLSRHVIIAGFGNVGEMVAKLLLAEHIPCVAFDLDSKRVKEAQAHRFQVFHGDGCKLDSWKRAGVKRAKAVVITLPSTADLKRTTRVIHKTYPDLPIVVRTEDLRNAKSLKKVGASVIVPEKYEVGLELAGVLLKTIGTGHFEISRLKNKFRAGNYRYMKEDLGSEKIEPHSEIV
jgi:CPA2 family monovalent cation:H+ antiporter-2